MWNLIYAILNFNMHQSVDRRQYQNINIKESNLHYYLHPR